MSEVKAFSSWLIVSKDNQILWVVDNMTINFILIFVLENKLVQWLKFTISGLGELAGIFLTFIYNTYGCILLTIIGNLFSSSNAIYFQSLLL